jgi:hypothetical protein
MADHPVRYVEAGIGGPFIVSLPPATPTDADVPLTPSDPVSTPSDGLLTDPVPHPVFRRGGRDGVRGPGNQGHPVRRGRNAGASILFGAGAVILGLTAGVVIGAEAEVTTLHVERPEPAKAVGVVDW